MKKINEYCKANLITEYLSTKVKTSSKEKPVFSYDSFENLLYFFENNDEFIEEEIHSEYDDIRWIARDFNGINYPFYHKDMKNKEIWFSMGGKFTEKNPLIRVCYRDDLGQPYKLTCDVFYDNTGNNYRNGYDGLLYSEVHKCFSWI